MKPTPLLLVLLALANPAAAQPAEAPARRDARLAWWREARFGMFIHWGPVSLKGTEISWSRANTNPKCPNKGNIRAEVYDNLYREFNPTNFNASDWVRTARSAGMKYVVLTAKHCDGFLLWHSKASDYNIAATPFQRDVCAELAAATRKQGLKIGWYFSPMDWRDPDFRTDRNAVFLRTMQAEVRELMSNYGRIDLLWFDWDGHEAVYDQPATYRIVKTLQPSIVIDNRLDLGKGNNNRQILSGYADYYTPEQELGSYDDQRPWESCMTLGTQWAWKPNDKIKSVAEVVQILANCAGGDGNLLLNVGPMPDGRIEPRQVEVLKAVGAWLRHNGQSIYGTRGGPWKPSNALCSTRKGKSVFLHVLKCNGERLELPDLPCRIRSATLLKGGKIAFRQQEGKLVLTVPAKLQDPLDTVLRLQLGCSAMSLPVL